MKNANFDIRYQINEKELLQIDLARFIGITPVTLSRWLNNPDLSEEKKKTIQEAVNALDRK